MKPINVALIGLGTVGCGVYQTFHIHKERLEELAGSPICISTIVIEHPEKHNKLPPEVNVTTDLLAVANDPEIDVVFEAIVGKEPAFSFLKKCIAGKKHVITANKEMFAAHGKELKSLAESYGTKIGFEATTAGGIPIIQTIQQLLQANQVKSVQAILNGTSNFILTAMRVEGLTFAEALSNAQKWGYAEADPTNDVEGYDALYKLQILSDLIFREQPETGRVKRLGIRDITADKITKSQKSCERIKHVATLEYDSKGNLTGSVEPLSLEENHPLYAVEGVNNAIYLKTDILGDLTLTGPGAGAFPTASAMVEDFCTILKKEQHLTVLS
ncbi:homoserine dehydrogenase [Virgibacillus kekensis]|uniref:Homoserine dehydrogenase n=1 Tax=Virgibacillus kekensis TaxID=202261 RepID=A0ABV9DK15_9BACI